MPEQSHVTVRLGVAFLLTAVFAFQTAACAFLTIVVLLQIWG